MGSIVGRIGSGQFGVMAVSLTRGDTLFQHKPERPADAGIHDEDAHQRGCIRAPRPALPVQHRCLIRWNARLRWHLTGNLYLRGDGDPSFSGRYMQRRAGSPDEFSRRPAGVSRCPKDHRQDHRRCDRVRLADDSRGLAHAISPGWLRGAGIGSLAQRESRVGDHRARRRELEPATTAIRLVSNVRTVPGGGASLSVRRSTDGTVTVSGRIGRNSPARRYQYVVEEPAPFATGALHAALMAKGIQVDGGMTLGRTPRVP